MREENQFIVMVVTLLVLAPFGLWKVVEILSWFVHHIHIGWKP